MKPSTKKDNKLLEETYTTINEGMEWETGGGPQPIEEVESPGKHKSLKQDIYKVSYHASHLITQEDLDSQFGGDIDQFIQEMIDQEAPNFNDPTDWDMEKARV